MTTPTEQDVLDYIESCRRIVRFFDAREDAITDLKRVLDTQSMAGAMKYNSLLAEDWGYAIGQKPWHASESTGDQVRMTSRCTGDPAAPRRIQRKRTKGWRMPPNTVYVGRPTKWGNRFEVGSRVSFEWYDVARITPRLAVSLFRLWLKYTEAGREIAEAARRELVGKDLACWCEEGAACHGDVLLRVANEEAGE